MRPAARQLTKTAAQRRTFVSAMGAATRATAAVARPAFAAPFQQQTRGVKTIDFAGTKEDVYGELERHSMAARDPVLTTDPCCRA